MTFKIILAVVLGIFTGKFFAGDSVGLITNFMDIGLCALLFFVGIDIGKNKDVISQIKEIGIKAISTPILVAIGSIIGAVVCGLILDTMSMSQQQ